jgi:uncharacterized protein YjbI with pentapeptide repeats
MVRCRYKIQVSGEEWECPLDALTGERHCYWHKEVDGKEPTPEQLEELKENKIWGVYLQEAKLEGANLQGAFLKRAELQNANLKTANMQKSYLIRAQLNNSRLAAANFQESNLTGANLQEALLFHTNFREACLISANFKNARIPTMVNFQKSNLLDAKLQELNLNGANFYKSNLKDVKLQGANLYGARFDSQTVLDDSALIGVNLFHSYFDEVKSFRNATVFQNDGDREINEIVGDTFGSWFTQILEKGNKYQVKIFSKLMFFNMARVSKKKSCSPLFLKPSVMDMGTIEKKAPSVDAKLHGKGLIRYAGSADKIIFFDWSSGCAIKNPENWRHNRNLIRVEELTDLILKDGEVRSEFFYKGSRASLYEASYEVYNNLYNFYIANGRLDQAAHVHYRRGEAHRKLRWARGGLTSKARSIFDLLILRTLTGYGDRIGRPIFWSGVMIGLFAFLFWLSDGIVKNVNGTQVAPDWQSQAWAF